MARSADLTFPSMGTAAHVIVVSDGDDTDELLELAQERIDALEARWTRFDDGSVVVEPHGERRAEPVSDTASVSDTPSKLVAKATGLTRRYGDTTVFENLDLELHGRKL